MGNAFYRQSESDGIQALTRGIPMLSSILESLGASGGKLSRLTDMFEQMEDPEVLETLAEQITSAMPGLEGLLNTKE